MEDHLLQRRTRMHHSNSHHHLLKLHPNQRFLVDHPLTTLHPQQLPRQTVMHLLLAHSLLLRRVLHHLHAKSHHNQTLMRHNHTARALVYPSNPPPGKLRLCRQGSQGQVLLRLLKAPLELDLQAALRAVLSDPLQILDQVQHNPFGRH